MREYIWFLGHDFANFIESTGLRDALGSNSEARGHFSMGGEDHEQVLGIGHNDTHFS